MRFPSGAGTLVYVEYYSVDSRSGCGLAPPLETLIADEVAVTDAEGRVRVHTPAAAKCVRYYISRPGFQLVEGKSCDFDEHRSWLWAVPGLEIDDEYSEIDDEYIEATDVARLAPGQPPKESAFVPTMNIVEEYEAQAFLPWKGHSLSPHQEKLLLAHRHERLAYLQQHYAFAYQQEAALLPRQVGELLVRVSSWNVWLGEGLSPALSKESGSTRVSDTHDWLLASYLQGLLVLSGGRLLLGDTTEDKRPVHRLWVFDEQGRTLASRVTSHDGTKSCFKVARGPDGAIVSTDARTLIRHDESLEEMEKVTLRPVPNERDTLLSLQILADGRALMGFRREGAPGVARLYGPDGILSSERVVGELRTLEQVGMLTNGQLVVAGEGEAGQCEIELNGEILGYDRCTSRVLILPDFSGTGDGGAEVAGADAFAIDNDQVVYLLTGLLSEAGLVSAQHAANALRFRREETRSALVTIDQHGQILAARVFDTRALGDFVARALDVRGRRVVIINRKISACDVVEF